METKTFRTNLNCESCVTQVTPLLNAAPEIHDWKVDLSDERKPLLISGEKVNADEIRSLIKKAGFDVFEEINEIPAANSKAVALPISSLKVYAPILLIFAYLAGSTILIGMRSGFSDWQSLMASFMGGFFLVFSFFKFLNLSGFADAYRTYDVIAKRVPVYGLIYPFIELGLGVAYIGGFAPSVTNAVTLVVMSVSSVGVIQSLLKKRKIECACLGTIFNLPMSKITLIEDFLMVGMAAATLAANS